MDRREFFKKAGLVGALSAAGTVTLKKGYVKPVIRLLEPGYAEAVTPVLSVTLSQPDGSEFKAGGGGTFTVGVWKIQVPVSDLVDIRENVGVNTKVKYTFQNDDGVVSGPGAGVPKGTEDFEIEHVHQTGEGEFRLTQSVGPSNTSAIGDGHGYVYVMRAVDHPKTDGALAEIFSAPSRGAPNDACMMQYWSTLLARTFLGLQIPETALPAAYLFISGARP